MVFLNPHFLSMRHIHHYIISPQLFDALSIVASRPAVELLV